MLITKIIIFRPRFDILREAAYTIFAIDSLRAFYLHLCVVIFRFILNLEHLFKRIIFRKENLAILDTNLFLASRKPYDSSFNAPLFLPVLFQTFVLFLLRDYTLNIFYPKFLLSLPIWTVNIVFSPQYGATKSNEIPNNENELKWKAWSA